MTPDFSVVIAAYNIEAYLERAIASALQQRNVVVEVIVVDDASTDKTLEIARRVSDPRVSIIALTENGGPGRARNAGIAAAKGKWIAVLDGDDRMDENRLERCLRRAKDFGANIVVDNLRVQRESDGKEYLMFKPAFFRRHPKLSLETFIGGNISFLGGAALGYMKPIFLRAFLANNHLSYDTDIRIGEDYLLLADALAAGGICACENSAGYLYTARAGSVSHRMTLDDMRRIEDGDRKFMMRHRLKGGALRKQRQRTARLSDAWEFTQLVDALKGRKVSDALKIAMKNPRTLWYLWRPIAARLGLAS